MACFRPLRGWRGRGLTEAGKRKVVFRMEDGFHELPVSVPCGQCVGCRLERSRQWAVRCMHEASLYDENCFITLTYDDKHLPAYGSLDKRAFQLFMKRLRERFSGRRIRFYHCGEYGSQFGRPHYHACLFGFDFPDKVRWTERNGLPVWRSAILEELWPLGLSEIGTVTFESAAYVARYIMKKVLGKGAEDAYTYADEDGVMCRLEPEYTTMSRRPGIGAPWLAKFGREVYPSDSVVVRGRLMQPPLFYDRVYELVNPEGMEGVRAARRSRVCRADNTDRRLLAREIVAAAKVKLSKRGLE